jgi:hypothetical protein
MASYWPQGWKKKRYHQIWEANLQSLRANVLAFISNLGPICNPKMLKVGPQAFSGPLTPSGKGT